MGEWEIYNGFCEEGYYDIRLENGNEYHNYFFHCGYFFHIQNGSIIVGKITHVRKQDKDEQVDQDGSEGS